METSTTQHFPFVVSVKFSNLRIIEIVCELYLMPRVFMCEITEIMRMEDTRGHEHPCFPGVTLNCVQFNLHAVRHVKIVLSFD